MIPKTHQTNVFEARDEILSVLACVLKMEIFGIDFLCYDRLSEIISANLEREAAHENEPRPPVPSCHGSTTYKHPKRK